MPGTIEEYMGSADGQRAADIIEQAMSEQKTGAEILSMLDESGLRIYPSEEAGVEGEEAMAEEGLPEELEEPPMDEELEAGPMEMGEEEEFAEGDPGMEPRSGQDGGMRDMRIDAVRFAMDKDKKNKEQAAQELA